MQFSISNFLAIFFLATFIEGTVKYVADPLSDVAKARLRPFKPYITMALGVGLAFNFHLDILRMFGLTEVVYSPLLFINYIITGVVIGRGSNYLNDFVSKLRGAERTIFDKVKGGDKEILSP